MKNQVNQIELKSNIRPSEPCTQAFRVVLHKVNGEWVTHCENVTRLSWSESGGAGGYGSKECPDYYWGHYHGQDYNSAVIDYYARCRKYSL